jgi:hypothetical protein
MRNILITVTLISAALLSTGCANLERNLQDPAIWQRVAEINERYDRRSEAIRTGYYGEPQFIDLTGEWNLLDGSRQSNRIRHGADGIMVIPTNGNQAVFYREIGLNLYRSAAGATYEFSTIHNGTWRSNDKRNRVIGLRRATWE